LNQQQACQSVKAVLTAAESKKGGSVGYTAYHVYRALQLLSGDSPVGRPRLQKELGIGEAAAKTLLSRLESLGLAEKAPGGKGHTATGKGREYYRLLSDSVRYYRVRATPLGDAYALVSPIPDPVRDLVEVYHVRDYLVAENCRVCIVGGVVNGVPQYPGVPEEERGSLSAWDPGVPRGLILVVPPDCFEKAYTGLLRLISEEYCGDT